ncbi:hypothetical protein BH10PSE14_BH10PSE14_18940 [soil metagenome]
MTCGLRLVAKALLLLTSVAMYGALNALHARGGVLTSILLAALLTFVAILCHELAHAAAAHFVGARIRAIVALPFRLRLHPPRLELIGRGGRGDLGGYVSYTLDRIDVCRKHAIIAAAGPLANLVLAALRASALTPEPRCRPGIVTPPPLRNIGESYHYESYHYGESFRPARP